MRFQKGQPKPANSGRQKGSKNVKKIARVADVLAEKGKCPATEILKLIDETESPTVKMQAWFDLLSYCQPKPKDDDTDPDDLDPDEVLAELFKDVSDETLLTLIKTDTEAV